MTDDQRRESSVPDQCNNPYDPDTSPDAHRAYREGWEARCVDKPHTATPYGADREAEQQAWMNGWQAAHLRFAQQ
jgi:ribosome modulation factor